MKKIVLFLFMFFFLSGFFVQNISAKDLCPRSINNFCTQKKTVRCTQSGVLYCCPETETGDACLQLNPTDGCTWPNSWGSCSQSEKRCSIPKQRDRCCPDTSDGALLCETIKNQAKTKDADDKMAGVSCLGGNGVDTAIGCIPVNDTNVFVGWMLGWAVGVGGGIAFLLIVYASFMIMTSQGVPDRLKAGQELLTSAISGLILLIFSVFILKFIGIDILGLGDFGFGK